MTKTIKYVLVRAYTPADKKNYRGYDIHVYAMKSSNRDSIVKYYRKVKQQKGYKNSSVYTWYIMTEDRAHEHQRKLHAWQMEEERKDLERRFPCRPMGKTHYDDIAEMMSAR